MFKANRGFIRIVFTAGLLCQQYGYLIETLVIAIESSMVWVGAGLFTGARG
jgi:hypothetical protein